MWNRSKMSWNVSLCSHSKFQAPCHWNCEDIYPKYNKKYAYALANEMTWHKKVRFEAKIHNCLIFWESTHLCISFAHKNMKKRYNINLSIYSTWDINLVKLFTWNSVRSILSYESFISLAWHSVPFFRFSITSKSKIKEKLIKWQIFIWISEKILSGS